MLPPITPETDHAELHAPLLFRFKCVLGDGRVDGLRQALKPSV